MKHTYTLPEIPALVPAPSYCHQTSAPVISLDGTWMLLHTTDYENEAKKEGTDGYLPVAVPSWIDRLHQPAFCGAYIYKTRVAVTEEMAASRVVLRFESVNGFATVYINGKKAAYHQNSCLTWNTEITDLIAGCSSFELAVTVDERAEKVSTFGHGGICHNVSLYLLPASYLSAVHTTTTFDLNYINASLRVDYGLCTTSDKPVILKSRLYDPDGNMVPEGCSEQSVSNGHGTLNYFIPRPFAWDAEHPYLYTIELELEQDDIVLERVSKEFGFRQITRKENQLFINGKEVKLRGSCRHEVTALDGRATTPELIEADVKLFKEANCNYIRTSHYPPTEYFLTLCDRYGIYVEDELALAFIARTLDYTQQDPQHTARYLSHFSDAVARDYSHPSVIIWSLCNESFGGYNFDLLNRFAKATDPTRVTKFSYPMTIREEYEPVDIWSIHYANYESDLSMKRDNVSVGGAFGKDMPVIHDEYVHVPCYNRTEHRRDPHVREFWGMSIARFWTKIWNTKGALGGAIWAGIDETSVYVGGDTCLEWGIIDIWRRRKPEHYGTRKAYSPILLRGVTPLVEEIAAENGETPITLTLGTDKLTLPVENRFCHTNLKETQINGWFFTTDQIKARSIEDCRSAKSAALSSFCQNGPDTAPFGKTTIEFPIIPQAEWLYIEWLDAFGNQVDEYLIPLTENTVPAVSFSPVFSDASVLENESELSVSFADDRSSIIYTFDRTTGLISSILRDGKPAVTGGPVLHLPYLKLPEWSLTSFSWKEVQNTLQITTRGRYGTKADVTYDFTVSSSGMLTIRYTINELNAPMPPAIKLRVGVDCGGLDELGITIEAAPGTDILDWNRRGAYSVYPEESIGRNIGTSQKDIPLHLFGSTPPQLWKDDCRHDILNGKYDPGLRGSNDFCSLKANLYCASLNSADCRTAGLKVISDGKLHLRAEAIWPENLVISCDDSRICYEGQWWPMRDSAYESSGKEMWSNECGAKATVSFNGTGIVWYAPVDVSYGIARVFVDGVLADNKINQRIDGVDFPGSSAGFDKKYNYPVFSVTGLSNGPHTLTIEVTGEHAPDSCDSYIVLENFCVIPSEPTLPVSVHLLKDYNYPHIAWGNWTKPAIIPALQETGEVTLLI